MIKYILGISVVVIIIAALFNISINTEPQEKNYRHDAYQLIELTHHKVVANEGQLNDMYHIILIDNFVSKKEFDMFYKEVLIVFPHIKKFGLNLKE